ncbi:MAG TPA: GNAT family N-acetyltransferase [Stellaceae bacterium]|nr:GNAT family N-acetyltransferase [Stellaceae bacterium]
MHPFRIRPARAPADIATAAALFEEYAAGLGVDLGYQGFPAELAGLPGAYAPPAGELLLALAWGDSDDALGCVALRPLEGGRVCEMKRLYVRPAGRRLGLGQALVAAVVARAAALGYAEMKLDTLPSMGAAAALYRKFGFTEIAPYYASPIAGTLYLSRALSR